MLLSHPCVSIITNIHLVCEWKTGLPDSSWGSISLRPSAILTPLSRVALVNNHIRIVQASILGSILVNLLLILGSALLASTLSGGSSASHISNTQLLSCLLLVSLFVFLVPVSRNALLPVPTKQ